jgi:multicomponent Na+:H+ antiporter subunit D
MAQIGRSLAAGHADGLVLVAFVFIMVGFFIKAAIFPFHFWLADAHAVAPTPVCVLFSGVMVELGLYAVARVYWALIDLPFSSHRPALTGLLLVVGAITAVLAGIMCFGQRHIKRLLAFSTVSHMGLMLIGFALLRPDALAGTAMYVVGHGLSKGALFILSGILLHRFGSVDELELHDAAHGMKGTAIVWFIAGLGLAGLPMFATFLGEHSIEDTAEKAGQSWVWIIFLISAMLTAGAVFRVCGRVFFGWGRGEEAETGGAKKIDEGRETKPDHRVPAVMIGPAIALVGLALAVGLIPRVPQMFRLSAFEFADAAGYQARVLDHAAIPVQEPEEEHTSKMPSVARACGATAGALLLAAFALSPLWPRKKAYARPVRGAVWALRCMHSGHVGDYVAFLTFGVAAFGAVLAYFIH